MKSEMKNIVIHLIVLVLIIVIVVSASRQSSGTSEIKFRLSEEAIKQAKEIAAKESFTDLSLRRPVGLSKLDSNSEIQKIIEESMKELGIEDSQLQIKAQSKLRYLGKPALPYILEGLHSDNPKVRKCCVSLLANRGSVAVPYLSDAVRTDSDKFIRFDAAHYLGQIFDPNAVPALLIALEDKEYYVQIGAANALGFLRDKRAFEPLREILENTNANGQVRHAAAEAILRIEKEEGSKVIQAAIIKDKNDSMRNNFNAVLKSYGETGYWPPDLLDLYQLTKDADTLAGESFSETEIKKLLEYIDSSYWSVSSGCLNALAKLKASKTVPEIIARGRKGSGFYHCLAKIGSPEAVEYLLECIQSTDRNIRTGAIDGLGDAGKWAVPVLVELLDDQSLRTTHRGEAEPIDAFNGIWPDSHKAYISLQLCLSNNGVKSTWMNLASGAKFNIDDEIRHLKEWWNNYGEDFLQGKTVPNPNLKDVYLLT